MKNGKMLLVIGILVFLLMGGLKKEAGMSVSRTITPSTVSPSGTVTVTFTPSSTQIQYWAFSVPIPNLWSCSQSTIGATCASPSGGTMDCYSATETIGQVFPSISFTCTAPSQTGAYTFQSGSYAIENEEGTLPSIQETVETGCTPNWQQGSWTPSTCPSSCTQTRTVTDSNNCGTNDGKPTTSQSCTGGSCNPSSLSVSRTITPSTVAPSGTVTVTFTPSSTQIRYWAFSTMIPDLWSCSQSTAGATCAAPSTGKMDCYSGTETVGLVLPSISFTCTSPSTAGTYTFAAGEYGIEQATGTLLSNSVTVQGGVGPVCGDGTCDSGETSTSCPADCDGTCTDTTWAPEPSTMPCNQTFQQISNCDKLRDATGTKDCPTCENMWEEWSTTKGKCVMAQWAILVIGFMAFIMVISFLK